MPSLTNLNFFVQRGATFRSAGHFQRRTATQSKVVAMKQLFPVVLALIPLAAVIGACVTCP